MDRSSSKRPKRPMNVLTFITRRVIILAFVLLGVGLLPVRSHAQTTVTGTLISGGGSPTQNNAFVRFRLRGFSGSVPRLDGTGACATGAVVPATFQVTPNGSGQISTTVCGNDVVTPDWTFYTVEYWYNGTLASQYNYLITGASLDLDTAVPLATPPTPVGLPSGTFGQLLVTGTSQLEGQVTLGAPQGTAPLVVTSNTNVPNLNASLLLGETWASPGAIGSTTPSTGAFTNFSYTGNFTGVANTIPAGDLQNANANFVLAGPTSGGSGAISARALVSADIPNNAASTTGNASTATALASSPSGCSSGHVATGIQANGTANCSSSNSITIGDLEGPGSGTNQCPVSASGGAPVWGSCSTIAFSPNRVSFTGSSYSNSSLASSTSVSTGLGTASSITPATFGEILVTGVAQMSAYDTSSGNSVAKLELYRVTGAIPSSGSSCTGTEVERYYYAAAGGSGGYSAITYTNFTLGLWDTGLSTSTAYNYYFCLVNSGPDSINVSVVTNNQSIVTLKATEF